MWRRGSALVFGYPRWEQLLEWQGKVKLCCWCKVAIVKLVEIWICAGVKLSQWKKHSFKLRWLWSHIFGSDQVTPFEEEKSMMVGLSINDSAVPIVTVCLLRSKSNCKRVHVICFLITLTCITMLEYNFWHTTFIYTTVQMFRVTKICKMFLK